jgi:hypothetical protein
MGVLQRNSLTFSSVYPYVVLLGRARRKEQRRAVHKATTLARKHDLEQSVVNLGYPNPRENDERSADGCWTTEKCTGIG